MGVELQWNPVKKQWDIYSTVVCDFVGTAQTPEEVADRILGGDEFYYYRELDPEEKQRLGRSYLIARAEKGKGDPKAKAELRRFWIDDAVKARQENRRVSLVCEVEFKPTGEVEIRRLPDW